MAVVDLAEHDTVQRNMVMEQSKDIQCNECPQRKLREVGGNSALYDVTWAKYQQVAERRLLTAPPVTISSLRVTVQVQSHAKNVGPSGDTRVRAGALIAFMHDDTFYWEQNLNCNFSRL